MANLRVWNVAAGPTTARLRVRGTTVSGPQLTNAGLRVRGVSVAGPALANGRLRIREVVVSGPSANPANARLRVAYVAVSGPTSGILGVNTTTPASGATVVLVYSGDQAVPVTWRIVSSTGGVAAVLVSNGATASVYLGPVTSEQQVTIGARQGSGAETTSTVKVQPAERFRQRSGIVVPVAVYGQRPGA